MYISAKRFITLKTLCCFLLINAVLTIAIAYQYILYAPAVEGWLDYLYLHVALVSNFLIIYIAGSIGLLSLLMVFPGKLPLFLIALPLVIGIHIITFVDVCIYRIFKFHINSMVINLFQTEGAWDSVHLGVMTLVNSGVVITVFVAFEVFLLHFLYKRCHTFHQQGQPCFPTKIQILIVTGLILTLILSDKFTYAVSDVYNTYQITRHRAVFPLYYGFTMKRFLRKYLRVDIDREENIHFTSKTSPLNYPKKALERKPLPIYPNIIWILLDAWRFDMLNPEVSPHIWEFSKKALVFDKHYSGGNASRFGIFSLFFGVYAYYWHQFLGARQSAVLIDELIDLGYDFRIVSSTRLTYPEFRKTAFIKIPESIDDRRDGELADEKDPQTARHFLEWLDNRTSTAPFFSFLFFDAPHGPYSYPDEFMKFTPAQKAINYLTVGPKDTLSLKNSYKNAIYFDDWLVGKILAYLENKGFLHNTIVLISADHGEEFYESGFFGHTSAFTQEQTKIPLLLYLPNHTPRKIERLTSHLDVVPTMLSLLGYTSSSALYSQGFSLLDEQERKFVISCGWADCAIIDDSHTIVFSTETYNSYLFEVRNARYELIDDYQVILNQKYEKLVNAIEGFGEFNK